MALSRSTRITAMLVIDVIFFFIEIISGYMVHSLALVADAFHMLNDVLSLVVALWAVRVSTSGKTSERYSYGWQRAEILGALVNGIFLVALCFTIFVEAIQRFFDPPTIEQPQLILIVGSLGILSNILGLFLFHDHGHGAHKEGTAEEDDGDVESVLPANVVRRSRPSVDLGRRRPSQIGSSSDANEASAHEHQPLLAHDHSHHNHATNGDKKESGHSHGNLNMKGVFLHILGDFLGNIGVIATALFIWLTNYSWRFYFDPAVSLLITAIILGSAIPLCRAAGLILLQGTPEHLSLEDIKSDINSLPGIVSVHELHVWQLSDTKLVASAHLHVGLPRIMPETSPEYMILAKQVRECFHSHGVHSSTIQPEFIGRDDIPDIPEETCLLDCGDECANGKCCSGIVEVGPNGNGHSH